MSFYVDGGKSAVNVQLVPYLPCEPGVFPGAVVRFSNGQIALAIADAYESANVIGIVETVVGSLCTLRTEGITGEHYTGLNEAAEYFLSDTVPGGITTTPPTAIGHVLYKIGIPVGSTRLFVEKTVRIVRS